MSIAYKIKRRWFVFRLRTGAKLKKSVRPFAETTTTEQAKALLITKMKILDQDSKLYYSVNNEDMTNRYFIENGHMFIKITSVKLVIINGKYQYDFSFVSTNEDFVNIKRIFMRNLDHRLDKIESEINKRVEKSLDHILRDIEEKNEQDRNN